MNALESQLDYAFGDTLPDSGRTMQVAPGVCWLRMGLPFALNHINLLILVGVHCTWYDGPTPTPTYFTFF